MSRLSYKSLFLIIVFLLIPIVFLLRLNQKANPASAGWFDDKWGYRKAVSIGNTGSILTNIQVKLLSNSDLSALVTAGKLQASLNDLRFTDTGGKLFSYWIEDSTNNSVDVWGYVPSIPSGGATVYMYYGNPSAPGVSSTKNMTIGGTMTSVGGYRIHTFTSSGTLTNAVATNAEVLVVAGGGGGGTSWAGGGGGGGGGAGGLTYNSSYALTQGQIINVTVGVGGSAGTASASQSGNNGGNSIFGTITVIGGGGGAYATGNGSAGGSGGGGGYNSYSTVKYGGSGVVGIGNSGGNTSQLSWAGGAGGGGAGGVGGDNKINHGGGDGGSGLSYSITGSAVTYAGGGTGGSNNPGVSAANTGEGGDGAYSNNVAYAGANGIVVVRYPSATAGTPSASEEQSKAPVAYWSFDEGVGTTVFDSSSNKNNGTLSGPTWLTEDQCISGKCLYQDGLSNKYSVISSNITSGWAANNDFTVNLWFNCKGEGYSAPPYSYLAGLFIHGNSADSGTGGFYLRQSSISCANMIFQVSATTTSNAIAPNLTSGANKWAMITAKKEGDTLKLYENGVLVGSQTFAGANWNVNVNQQTLIGSVHGRSVKGLIDEVKVYPYARSTAEIKSDYTAGKAHAGTAKGSAVNLGSNPKSSEAFSDGLIGYWKMEENVGTTALDSSGNSNTGTIYGATTWSSGKYGIGISFGGATYVATGQTVPSTISISTWATFSADGMMWNRANSVGPDLWFTGGNIYLNTWDGYGNPLCAIPSDANNGQFHHYVLINTSPRASLYYDGRLCGTATYKNPAGAFIISSGEASYGWKGKIDEVRLYNRALSATEIKQLYEYAPSQLAYWKLDEGSGSSINDSSGNSKNGTLGTGNSSPTWTVGRYGNGLKFDGSNDYVSVGSTVSNVNSVSFWAKPSTTSQYFLDLDGGTHYISASSGVISAVGFSTPFIYINGVGTSSGLTANTWSYITVTSSASFNATNPTLGKSSTNFLNGSLDDIRLYNYVLNTKQIVSDFNAGHPNVGSPIASALAHYKFDEGYGTIANNFGNGGTTLNGTFGAGNSAPTWTQNGKFGKALSFGGDGDVVNLGNNVPTMTEGSLSMWVNRIGSTTTYQMLYTDRYPLN